MYALAKFDSPVEIRAGLRIDAIIWFHNICNPAVNRSSLTVKKNGVPIGTPSP